MAKPSNPNPTKVKIESRDPSTGQMDFKPEEGTFTAEEAQMKIVELRKQNPTREYRTVPVS